MIWRGGGARGSGGEESSKEDRVLTQLSRCVASGRTRPSLNICFFLIKWEALLKSICYSQFIIVTTGRITREGKWRAFQVLEMHFRENEDLTTDEKRGCLNWTTSQEAWEGRKARGS